MNVMISIPWFSPGFKAGGPVQSLRNLVSHPWKDLSFRISTSSHDLGESLPLSGVTVDDWVDFNQHTQVFYGSPDFSLGQRMRVWRTTVDSVTFIVGIYSFRHTLIPLLFTRSARIILSARGMLHPPALRQKAWKKKVYLALLRPLLRWRNVEFHATDEEEKQHICRFMGIHARTWVASNLPQSFRPVSPPKKAGALVLITVALIGPMKNHLQVLEALRDCPDSIEYLIVGPVYFPAYWKACLAVIQSLPPNIRVTYAGAIPPDQLSEWYDKAHVFICPSKSENFGHAFYEALSAGKPVITSHTTPWNNLFHEGIGLNVEVQPASIAEAILHFSGMDSTAFDLWHRRAAAYARQPRFTERPVREHMAMFAGNPLTI